ncbi:MAG: OsmC family protein [Candidatus Kapaibacterium sp.]
MTETMSTIPGFNVETMEGFAGYAAENPNDVQLGVEAKVIWTGRAGHSTAKIGRWSLGGQPIEKKARDYSIQFGAWKEVEGAIGVEGADDKLEPIEVALAAMCGCVNWAICINAALEGVSFDELEVSARITVDPRVLLGILPIEEAASCLQEVSLDISARGENLTEEDRRRIEAMAHRSPVHAMIRHANTIHTNVAIA